MSSQISKMTTLFYKTKRGYKTISVDKIMLTPAIVDSIRQHGGSLKNTSNKGYRDGSFPLTRIDSIRQAFDTINLDPIVITPYDSLSRTVVCKTQSSLTNNNDSYYKIVDGRHRFVASILASYDSIPYVEY